MRRTVERAIASANTDDTLIRHFALELLSQSVQYGHERLSVRRLLLAAKSGAAIPERHWSYCERIVMKLNDPGLAEVYHSARRLSLPATTAPDRLANPDLA
jgi:hypothetical protein